VGFLTRLNFFKKVLFRALTIVIKRGLPKQTQQKENL